MATNQTIGNAYGGFNAPTPGGTNVPFDYNSTFGWYQVPTGQTDAQGNPITRWEYNQENNEDAIRSRIRNQFQGEIDATNSIFAEKLAEARRQGLGRLGSGRAIQARSGLLGSDFGATQTKKINDANVAEEALVLAEQNAKIAEIMGKASSISSTEIAAKRAAAAQGAEKYIEHLKTAAETKKSNLAALSQSFIDQNVSPDALTPEQLGELALKYGTSPENIKAGYAGAKKAADEAKAKADAQAIKDRSFNIGEGEDQYVFDPATNTYKKIASKGKTYAPKDTTYSTTPGTPGYLSPLAQAVQNGTIPIAQLPAAARAAVAAELATSGVQSNRQQVLSSNLAIVDELLAQEDLGAISGIPGAAAFIPGTKTQKTINLYNQLKGVLSLENREKLKGQGAISDFEFKVLSDAASALGRNLDDASFKAALEKVREVFQGRYALTNYGATNPAPANLVPGSASPAAGTDGAAYGFPGYVSDGTQWVLK